MAKANKITNHSNIHSPMRNQYKHIIEPAPRMTKEDYFANQKIKFPTQASMMTLGGSPSGTFQATASFRDLNLRPAKIKTESKSVIVSDCRMKPKISIPHKNSEFDQYMWRHRSPAFNAVPKPFEINEDGRQKKTDVEDYIIQRKHAARKEFER